VAGQGRGRQIQRGAEKAVETRAGGQYRISQDDGASPGQGGFPERRRQIPQLPVGEGACKEGQGGGPGKRPGAAYARGKEETALAEQGGPQVRVGNKNYKMKRIMRFHFLHFHATIASTILQGKTMKYKTKVLVERFVKELSGWPGVECVSLNEAALPDTIDTYFALILDVFCSGKIPAPEERCGLYGDDVVVFETANQGSKDRFLIGDIPVRLEYKSTAKIEELVDIADSKRDQLWLIKDSGTYGYYRLNHGEVLFARTGWIDAIRERLHNLDMPFWRAMRDANQSKMEHYVSDLGAALIQGDNFHYLISSAGFIKSACLTLFCINRRFEPSHRAYGRQVRSLGILPESFLAQFEAFLSNAGDLTMERKYSLAQLMARGIIAL
jgi:hypothetical protein